MITIKVRGQITDIFPSEVYGSFEKRVAWIQDSEDNKAVYSIEFWGADAATLDNFKAGELVTANCEVRGKKWSKNGKEGVFVSLRCTWLQRAETDPDEDQGASDQNFEDQETSDDLPF